MLAKFREKIYGYNKLKSGYDGISLKAIKSAASIINTDELPLFKVTAKDLWKMLEDRNIDYLKNDMGGISGICSVLQVDPSSGLFDENTVYQKTSSQHSFISVDIQIRENGELQSSKMIPSKTGFTNISKRQEYFGKNQAVLPDPPTFLGFVWDALHDKTLLMLMIAAFISLSIGIYEDLQDPGQMNWIEGVAIIMAVTIVVLVGSVNSYNKEKQFQKLYSQSLDRKVFVHRSRCKGQISIFDIVVGDIVYLEVGDIAPADGILIQGSGLKCDESPITGESENVSKESRTDADCWIISGTRVMEGEGKMVVTGVGSNSTHGRVMETISSSASPEKTHLENINEMTPLQHKLETLAESIARLGMASAILMFVLLCLKIWISGMEFASTTAFLKQLLNILIQCITIVVVAVPEGLPMAVALALAFATARMIKDNNLVRIPAACETMGNATVICSDKTGTLTENQMTVIQAVVFQRNFYQKKIDDENVIDDDNSLPDNSNDDLNDSINVHENTIKANETNDPPGNNFKNHLFEPILPTLESVSFSSMSSPNAATQYLEKRKQMRKANINNNDPQQSSFTFDQILRDFISSERPKEILTQSLLFNTTAIESSTWLGNKTEIALLQFLKTVIHPESLNIEEKRREFDIHQRFPFSSDTKSMTTIICIEPYLRYRAFIKGAPEIILPYCKHWMNEKGQSISFDAESRSRIEQLVTKMSESALRTIAIAYQDLVASATDSNESIAASMEGFKGKWKEPLITKYTLLAVMGIEDPPRAGVQNSILDCKRAGVSVKMVTGDSTATAKAIAKQCGIMDDSLLVMEGPKFRRLSDAEARTIAPRLAVLARSSPFDKQRLVQILKGLGEVVAVTGDGTNDAPALKTADVGFSMGICGTQVAKQASSIILMDDKFESIVKALLWGRCVNEAVRKFLQFQMTVNITAVIVTLFSALTDSQNVGVLTATQLLWVNMIMDTFAALALATDQPRRQLLDQVPERRNVSLINPDMWKMIVGQSIFQIVINIILVARGPSLVRLSATDAGDQIKFRTFIFTTFVMMQLFNEINCRRLGNDLNVFRGIFENAYFVGILATSLLGQILIVNFGGVAFGTVPLDGALWMASVFIGSLSLPIGVFIRLLPNLVGLKGGRYQTLYQEEVDPNSTNQNNNSSSSSSESRSNDRGIPTYRSVRRSSIASAANSVGSIGAMAQKSSGTIGPKSRKSSYTGSKLASSSVAASIEPVMGNGSQSRGSPINSKHQSFSLVPASTTNNGAIQGLVGRIADLEEQLAFSNRGDLLLTEKKTTEKKVTENP